MKIQGARPEPWGQYYSCREKSALCQGCSCRTRFAGRERTAASEAVKLTPHVSIAVVAIAVGLAVLGGLVAGAFGGLRASRLRPADALRHID